jgi:protein ImuB
VQLDCRLDAAPGQPLLLAVGLFRPSAEPAHLWDLLRMQLEQATLVGPVGRITLAARLTAPLENRQGELFAGGEHEAQRQLALFIDRCSSRLGANAVLRAELTADPLPERAFKVQSSRFRVGKKVGDRGKSSKFKVPGSKLQADPSTRSRRGSSPDSRPPTPDPLRSPLHRPLFLYDPPRPLEVLSVAPDGPPISFDFAEQRHSVVAQWGPERIETGWWRGRSIHRDYWRIETASGQRFWLFRALDDGKWHLQGEF